MQILPRLKCEHKQKHGFNLVEAAIVLGVVGLVIGGIWVAAASVASYQRQNEVISGVLQLLSNARKFPYADINNQYGTASQLATQLKWGPDNWKTNCGSTQGYYSPVGTGCVNISSFDGSYATGSYYIGLSTDMLSGHEMNNIIVRLRNIPNEVLLGAGCGSWSAFPATASYPNCQDTAPTIQLWFKP